MINIHISQLAHYQDPKWVQIERSGDRITLADSERVCLRKLRSGLKCTMDKGHKGRCASSTFYCDGCNKRRRGHPAAKHEEAGWFCFMCVDLPRIRFRKRVPYE